LRLPKTISTRPSGLSLRHRVIGIIQRPDVIGRVDPDPMGVVEEGNQIKAFDELSLAVEFGRRRMDAPEQINMALGIDRHAREAPPSFQSLGYWKKFATGFVAKLRYQPFGGTMPACAEDTTNEADQCKNRTYVPTPLNSTWICNRGEHYRIGFRPESRFHKSKLAEIS